MKHFVTELFTYMHISFTKWCIVGYLSLWDLWDGSILPHHSAEDPEAEDQVRANPYPSSCTVELD